jgi:hypothetical protein
MPASLLSKEGDQLNCGSFQPLAHLFFGHSNVWIMFTHYPIPFSTSTIKARTPPIANNDIAKRLVLQWVRFVVELAESLSIVEKVGTGFARKLRE